MKVISFIIGNLGRLHAINEKIGVIYNAWNTIFQAIAPLLPQHAAATAAVAAAVQQEPAADELPTSQDTEGGFKQPGQ